MSQISHLPLASTAPPWKVYLIQLHSITRDACDASDADPAKTCLVVKCHHRLAGALQDLLRSELNEMMATIPDANADVNVDAMADLIRLHHQQQAAMDAGEDRIRRASASDSGRKTKAFAETMNQWLPKIDRKQIESLIRWEVEYTSLDS